MNLTVSAPAADRRAAASPRPRLLVAPISITPTKPLLPTHVKGMLWVDLLCKASREVAEVTCIWNSRTPNLAGQTVQFWAYLDREYGGHDYAALDDLDIGRLYVEFHGAETRFDPTALRDYTERVERTGWVHPASARMLDLWSAQLRTLGVADPGLHADRPHPCTAQDVVDRLRADKLCLDQRAVGGPVYLDGTRWGVPLRPVIGADGHANYLLTALRDILPVVADHDHVLLVHDEEIAQDFVLVEKILAHYGVRTSRLALGRVPLGGVVQSSRAGGWDGASLGEISRTALAQFTIEEYRLGMRVYYGAMLGRAAGESFDQRLLYRAMVRARKLLSAPERPGDAGAFVRRHLTRSAWVDPYRLSAAVISRPVPRDVLTELFL
ncbi:hypothetical protein ABZ319_30670 [Nocardia sp. NPDC005978]|uniref:hypothetical protein n=1 Tax=Nocardia sp. NPDC005978 TaxID=3156725 RepID=UPI00339DD51C